MAIVTVHAGDVGTHEMDLLAGKDWRDRRVLSSIRRCRFGNHRTGVEIKVGVGIDGNGAAAIAWTIAHRLSQCSSGGKQAEDETHGAEMTGHAQHRMELWQFAFNLTD